VRAGAIDVAYVVIVEPGDVVTGLVTDRLCLVRGVITAPFVAVRTMAEGAMTGAPELMAHGVICLEPRDADE